jgi:hypothetical protein
MFRSLPFLVLLLAFSSSISAQHVAPEPDGQPDARAEAQTRTYTTTFSTDENPLSENGSWINGKTTGLDWQNMRVVNGIAIGTQSGTVSYDDSTAVVAGEWGPDQTVYGTVYTNNARYGHEVEFRLRTTITPHSITGYEVLFRPFDRDISRIEIVRWNGPLGDFDKLTEISGRGVGVNDGDVLKATMIGDTITVYINGVQKIQTTDSTFTSGAPGIGMYLTNGGDPTELDRYGWRDFTASAPGAGIDLPPSPTNLRVR